ncbi:MAG: hypothetical protein LBU32_14370 [Clostridiales bacterium]|jgi:hypothetical protein|nr:hypothetical protein [Clostridiales bacterium]
MGLASAKDVSMPSRLRLESNLTHLSAGKAFVDEALQKSAGYFVKGKASSSLFRHA